MNERVFVSMLTWPERVAEATVAADSGGGVSDQVRRSEVLVCGFLTGVPLCILNVNVKVSE